MEINFHTGRSGKKSSVQERSTHPGDGCNGVYQPLKGPTHQDGFLSAVGGYVGIDTYRIGASVVSVQRNIRF